MKKLILLVAFVACSLAGSAQAKVYDYLVISFSPEIRNLVVNVSREEQRVITFEELKARNGKSSELDLRSALELVQEYEKQGWEMIDFQRDAPGSSSALEKWTWLMRKPKQ